MTAAGVQNTDSTAYLPPSPSSSTPDAKGTGAAGKPAADPQASDTQGQPSDFQNELELQQADKPAPEPAGQSDTSVARSSSGKSGKKRNARPDDSNLSAVIPVQVAAPQKQILPLALTLAQPQENPKPDENAKPAEKTIPDDIAQGSVRQSVQPLPPSIAALAQLPTLPQPTTLKQSVKLRQSLPTDALTNRTVASNATPATAADPGKISVLPLAPVPSVAQDTAVRQEGKKSEDPPSQDAAIMPATRGASADSQQVSRTELKLPAAPPEPAAAAIKETVDAAPSSPSALAFAARLTAVPQKTGDSVAAPASQSLDAGSQTQAQIPMRYAATAEIIQSAALGNQQDAPKKDQGEARTDIVLPRFETLSEAAPSSGSAAPQQAAPTARPEQIVEPPATPPTSSHDIRVQVPNNNGGSTQVRFVESGGEVRVSVRTADDGLAQNLRTHLNDLNQRLSDGGISTEIWKPASNAASSQNDSQQQAQQDGRGSGGQGSGGQGGQQDRQQKRPAWLEEMESSLHGEQN
jgi:hypothetical protein